ncbi:MAG: phenylalanine 4-monooxygenase, partial [Betaproteobacteria bacterium]|nr:phenylalanine 4-monooxygenase [Betaproteobacteria bacterium]
MAGQTDHALRGDYSNIRPDYTVDQDYSLYTAEEQGLWKRLYARQSAQVPQYACDEFIDVLGTLNFGTGIPRFDEVNEKLMKATR